MWLILEPYKTYFTHPIINNFMVTYHLSSCSTGYMVTTLMSQLAAHKTPVSVEAFDSVLEACAEADQMTLAVNTIRCMTRVYGIAPSRKVCVCVYKCLVSY